MFVPTPLLDRHWDTHKHHARSKRQTSLRWHKKHHEAVIRKRMQRLEAVSVRVPPHAHERLNERSITLADVRRALVAVRPQPSHHGRSQFTFEGTVIVMQMETPCKWTLVTAWKTTA